MKAGLKVSILGVLTLDRLHTLDGEKGEFIAYQRTSHSSNVKIPKIVCDP